MSGIIVAVILLGVSCVYVLVRPEQRYFMAPHKALEETPVRTCKACQAKFHNDDSIGSDYELCQDCWERDAGDFEWLK